ncbi:MAG: HEAT repeat domain-containing protein [Thermodesulfobacteriota bacterium]
MLSVALLLARPEPSETYVRDFLNWFMFIAFAFGFLSVLVFANRWRALGLIGLGLFLAGLAGMYLIDRFAAHTVGSPGWGIGLVLIAFVFPTAVFLCFLSGVLSLAGLLDRERKNRRWFFAGLALPGLAVVVLSWLVLRGPDVDKLLAALDSPDPHVRIETIIRLGKIDNVRAAEALIGLLKNKEAYIRAEAAYSLGNASYFQSLLPLTEALEDEEVQVRLNAARSLGTIIGRFKRRRMFSRQVEALARTLRDQNPGVRGAAAEALGLIGDKRAVDSLIAALADEKTRLQAHQALVSITGRDLGPAPGPWKAWQAAKGGS